MISDHRYKNRFHVFFLMVCMGGFVILQTVYDLGGTLVGITLLFTDHRVCEEKSVIKIFYDNDWGWKLVPELASLVLYITGLSGHVKSRRKFPPVLLEIYGLFW